MLALIMILACTENERARDWGGTVDIDVPCDHQVFDVTWKGDNFWYATQDPPKDWTPRNPPSSDGGNSSGGNPASNAEPSPTTA